jgi:hypothetical protein
MVMRSLEEVAAFKESYTELIMTPQQDIQSKYDAMRQNSDPALFEDWMTQYDPTNVERSAMFAITTVI